MNTQLLNTLRLPLVAILAFSLVRCGENQAAVTPPADVPIPVKVQPVSVGNQGRTLQTDLGGPTGGYALLQAHYRL